jgi:hypothetical protein
MVVDRITQQQKFEIHHVNKIVTAIDWINAINILKTTDSRVAYRSLAVWLYFSNWTTNPNDGCGLDLRKYGLNGRSGSLPAIHTSPLVLNFMPMPLPVNSSQISLQPLFHKRW